MFIYQITNRINDKIYIGQTTGSLEKRWRAHCSGNAKTMLISRAIQKHGKENFDIKMIDFCVSLEVLNAAEAEYIESLNALHPNGYNLRPGGNNSPLSEESKNKIREANTGKRASADAIVKMSIAHFGRPKSEAHRMKFIGNKNSLGVRHSEETRQKMRDAHKHRPPISESTRQKKRSRMLGNKHGLGHRHSEEHKRKISLLQLGVPKSPEHRKNWIASRRQGIIERRKFAWSMDFERCVECQSTERKYGAKGRCELCYRRSRSASPQKAVNLEAQFNRCCTRQDSL